MPNIVLKKASLPASGERFFALLDDLGLSPEAQQAYVQDWVAGLSENTRASYLSGLRSFRRNGFECPATPETVAAYVKQACVCFCVEGQWHLSQEPLSVASLELHLAALSFFHRVAGLSDPVQHVAVAAALRRVKKERGTAQQLARPLVQDDMISICNDIRHGTRRGRAGGSSMSLIDYRDMALMLIGFSGAFRRSELCALQWEDVQFDSQWVILRLRHSKTDQTGEGFAKLIYRSTQGTGFCPVRALRDWQEVAGLQNGAVFRGMTADMLSVTQSLTGRQVDRVIKKLATRVGLPDLPVDDLQGLRPQFSGHSLRAGFVTTCARKGISTAQIKKITGQKTDRMVAHYTRFDSLAQDNPTEGLW